MKKCFKCKLDKELIDFYPHKQMADGHLNKCRDCARKDSATQLEVNKLNPDWVAKEKERVRLKQLRMHGSKRTEIYNQVKVAILTGSLKTEPCIICGEAKAEGHHEDYNKPLDLVWLCKRHHSDRHLHLRMSKLKNIDPLPIHYFIQITKSIIP